jgi:diguanylate cyclase (GGDEF)-like protein
VDAEEAVALVSDQYRARVIRFLLAAPSGIEFEFLSPGERSALDVLVEQKIATISEAVACIDRESAGFEAIARAARRLDLSDQDDEIEQLRRERRDLAETLTLVQDLINAIAPCRTIAELFRAAFRRLSETVVFDVGSVVMLEQNLDLYVSKLPQHEDLVNDRLIDAIKTTLDDQISASFSSTDVIVRGDFSDLPEHRLDGDPLEFTACALLRLDSRIAGSIVLHRAGREFGPEEKRVLGILADQIAIVLGNIRAQDRIQSLADTDDLTGIANKRVFRRQLPAEVERAFTYQVPLSLILFDVDDFKFVNDTFGHVIGDVLLSELCGAVRETLRTPDVFARFGGDEFAVILPHTDLEGAQSVARRMIKGVRELVIGDDTEPIHCTISVGIASLEEGWDASDLTKRADEKLYESKHRGKDRASW